MESFIDGYVVCSDCHEQQSIQGDTKMELTYECLKKITVHKTYIYDIVQIICTDIGIISEFKRR
jgi:hypothetical protein